MHSVALFASIVAVAAPALAQVLVPTPWFSEPYFPQEASEYIGAGKPYTINWDASELGNWPIRVDLLGGDDEASLHEVTFIANIDNQDFTHEWAVPCWLGEEKIYVIKFTSAREEDNGDIFNISPPIAIDGPHCHSSFGTPTSFPAKPTSYSSKPSSYPAKPTSYVSQPSSYLGQSISYPSKPKATVTPSSGATGGYINSTIPSTPIPTAGANRVGAGLGLGFLVGALAL